MFQFIINSLIMINSLIFSQMKHPLSMGLVLLVQAFLISLTVGLISKTFWFSYILFLVFLGGMLVMFIYVTSIASNEVFNMSSKLIITSVLLLFMSIILFLILDMTYIYSMMNLEMMSFNSTEFLMIEENSINLIKLYNYSTNLITLFLMNYLFLTLIVSVKITNFFYGPLRPSF